MKGMLKMCLILLVMATAYSNTITYTAMVTKRQFLSMFHARILQFKNKSCQSTNPLAYPKACADYCAARFIYAPDAPYNNAMLYNATSGQCQSKQICPAFPFVVYESRTNTCMDSVSKLPVAGIAAVRNATLYTINITIICVNGKLTKVFGLIDCQCDFGYTSRLTPINDSFTFQKCEAVVPISAYLPQYLQIYYDEDMDNQFPNGNDPDYWEYLVIYYVRHIRNVVVAFFQPYQVQIAMLLVPKQSLTVANISVLVAIFVAFILICLATIHQNITKAEGEEKS